MDNDMQNKQACLSIQIEIQNLNHNHYSRYN